jgi:hypothetical protein
MQIAKGTVGLSSQVVDIFVTEITLAYTSTSTSSNVTLNSINPQTARSGSAWFTSTSEECRGMGINANYFPASSVGYLQVLLKRIITYNKTANIIHTM